MQCSYFLVTYIVRLCFLFPSWLLIAAEDKGRWAAVPTAPPSPRESAFSSKSLISIVTAATSARTFSLRRWAGLFHLHLPSLQGWAPQHMLSPSCSWFFVPKWTPVCLSASEDSTVNVTHVSALVLDRIVQSTIHRYLGLIFPGALWSVISS